MASSEESNPLLPSQDREAGAKTEEKSTTPPSAKNSGSPPPAAVPIAGAKTEEKSTTAPSAKNSGSPPPAAVPIGWTVDGIPVSGSVAERGQWNSSIFSCLGSYDEFWSSDLEVCLLGSMAPCVLYGTNVERLGSTPNTFSNHCLPYTGFYFLGNALFGSNILAPCFSYPTRTAIRRKFNLEGSCEALARSYPCVGGFVEDEVQLEQCETACDFATHVCFHSWALCQEGREIRRKIPHPGFCSRPVMAMTPPGGQSMGRGE